MNTVTSKALRKLKTPHTCPSIWYFTSNSQNFRLAKVRLKVMNNSVKFGFRFSWHFKSQNFIVTLYLQFRCNIESDFFVVDDKRHLLTLDWNLHTSWIEIRNSSNQNSWYAYLKWPKCVIMNPNIYQTKKMNHLQKNLTTVPYCRLSRAATKVCIADL